MLNEIREDKINVNYIFIKVTSDALKRKIILYKNNLLTFDCFDPIGDEQDVSSIRILFLGDFRNGHFLSVVRSDS